MWANFGNQNWRRPLTSPPASRMSVQNVPVYAGITRTCVSTCARGAGTHGDVLNVHTGTFWVDTREFTPCHTTHTHTPHHTPQHKTQHNITQHDTPHHTPQQHDHNTTRRQRQRETEKDREEERQEKDREEERQDKRREKREERREKREERREKRLDWRASAVSSRAPIWRFWYEGRTWPTRRPPNTTLKLIITRMCTIPQGKVTSQYKANKASSECALFPRNPGVRPKILSTREKKNEKHNEKGTIFLKENKRKI